MAISVDIKGNGISLAAFQCLSVIAQISVVFVLEKNKYEIVSSCSKLLSNDGHL